MRTRDVGRWAYSFIFAVAASLAVAACGGAGGNEAGGDASLPNNGFHQSFLQDGGKHPPVTNSCTPRTCQDLGYTCGTNSDGCGGTIDCGSCATPDYCGGGGFSKCGNPLTPPDGGPICTPKTCMDLGYTCGPNSDGCGHEIDCGTCVSPAFCGGGGKFSVCGGDLTKSADGGAKCAPITCATLGNTCAAQGDGCGGMVGPCGTAACTPPQFCGGGGFNICGGNGTSLDAGVPPMCVRTTCTTLGNTCGVQGDGCGGTVGPCGTGACTDPTFCGGGGFNKCGGNNGLNPDGGVACKIKTCADYPGVNCGQESDGCGGLTASCGTCTDPQYCGGAGAGKCGGNNGLGADGGIACSKKTCASYPAGTCGAQSDGCGGLTAVCGTCTNPQFCGGAGPNQCGGNNGLSPDGGLSCTPKTCANYPGANCGPESNGCGGLTATCGAWACVAPQYCGGGGFDICGGTTGRNSDGGIICNPKTCASQGYNCGSGGDGCGNPIGPCGPLGGACPAGQFCGGGGTNVCGTTGSCSALCQGQKTCAGGVLASIHGTVNAATPAIYLAAGVTVGDPVPNVLVYVPNKPVLAFLPRASENAAQQCGSCNQDVSGDPLVQA
ncbi:MAG: hypothetical protein ACREJ3_20100, partial [Polyangiaceae bacterium]